MLAVVKFGRLLPRMFARAFKVAESPLRILLVQRGASSNACLLPQVRLNRRSGLGLIAARYRMSVLLLVMRHVLLLYG